MTNLEYLTTGSPSMKRKFNKLVDVAKKIPIPGANITADMTPGGLVFNAVIDPAEAAELGPFGIKLRSNPDDPSGNTFQAMVNIESDILLSPRQSSDFLACTGLGVWVPAIPNDVFAIYIVIAGGVPTSATFQSYGQGSTVFDPTKGPWSTSDDSFVFDDGGTPPAQIGINILIGYTTPDAKGKPYLIQAQTNHILIEQGIIQGRGALYDFSHRRRYGITAPGV